MLVGENSQKFAIDMKADANHFLVAKILQCKESSYQNVQENKNVSKFIFFS